MDEIGETPKLQKSPLPRMRRDLVDHTDMLTRTMTALVVIERGESPEGAGADRAWELLACTAINERWPPRDGIAVRVAEIVEKSPNKLPPYAPYAKAALQTELEIALSAARAIAFLDAINEPVPDRLLNLPAGQLARELNRVSFALARRVPGWKD